MKDGNNNNQPGDLHTRSWLLALLVLAFAGSACALPMSCDVAMVDGSVDCYGAVQGNDKLGSAQSAYTVNVLALFGYDDWQALGRDEGTGSPGMGFQSNGIGSTSGVWDIHPGYLPAFGSFMIVFKQGNSWAAFHFDDTSQQSGAWDVAGLSIQNNALSHATLYLREQPLTVAEPHSLLLIGAGLLALFVARSRRRKDSGSDVATFAAQRRFKD